MRSWMRGMNWAHAASALCQHQILPAVQVSGRLVQPGGVPSRLRRWQSPPARRKVASGDSRLATRPPAAEARSLDEASLPRKGWPGAMAPRKEIHRLCCVAQNAKSKQRLSRTRIGRDSVRSGTNRRVSMGTETVAGQGIAADSEAWQDPRKWPLFRSHGRGHRFHPRGRIGVSHSSSSGMSE